ncbi:hypothetical protein [Arcticibacter eurypsychrophilus]|uniref:hypothetical protein n=1 Tax=Arcticibacter eurypsychrophilus TaxID=1434752 RepID=UPI001FDF323E|nr:hypothetical protein [Arcticibacter eurypsychrophilus]
MEFGKSCYRILEYPDLLKLPKEGDQNKTKWVMYGASNAYMIGSFDGKSFTPEYGKYYFVTGTIYAAQTFSNIPESDGRRIQIGWDCSSLECLLFYPKYSYFSIHIDLCICLR